MPDDSPSGTFQAPPIPNQPSGVHTDPTPQPIIIKTSDPHKSKKPMNKLLPVVIILAILAVASFGVNIFTLMQGSAKSTEINNLKSQLEANGIEVKPSTDNDNTDQTPTSEISTATKDQIYAQIPENLIFMNGKCLNNENYAELSFSDHKDLAWWSNRDTLTSLASVGLNLTYNTASITLNWDTIKNNLGTFDNIDKSGEETFTTSDLGINGKVIDTLATGFGQATGDETLFFLMSDGSIEYIPLFKAIRENNIKSYGKLPNVENVIKFYKGNSRVANSDYSGGNNAFAQRADGDYYDLYNAITATGNY